MRPDRIALFGYAHVPWMAKNQRLIDEAALPGGPARAAQAEAAAEALAGGGYEAIGLDHFALPDDALAVAARRGILRRNFQGYTTDTAETLIGLRRHLHRALADRASCRTSPRPAPGRARCSIRPCCRSPRAWR
jgi:coproporphyrinogen III oxidase-like Fe-S oxidoreductase